MTPIARGEPHTTQIELFVAGAADHLRPRHKLIFVGCGFVCGEGVSVLHDEEARRPSSGPDQSLIRASRDPVR